ncbi:tetratricopeptide repeat protein [Uliginosibacterium sp. 31-16]|uniref:YfgM family protein n=1 Tax=Uliginosibacterium sp. 31-16 TaxID=3068315 RepID=UPI00273D559B|nr:tetratricopeptide repeat protein [Uliginosibacterium sp. 31-16]MDP5241004.1 tetratricopeptide repeat protein [Uliginosibacterium sp. 31-16]
MAAYDLEEQEQLSAIKAWWEKNGNRVTGAALALALVVAGTTGWRAYQARQAAESGAIYGAVAQADQSKDVAKLRVLTDEIISKHGDTAAAELAALLSAKAEIDSGDGKAARSRLEWAASKGADPLLRDLARLRLASVQLDEKDYAAALKTLEAAPAQAFTARFEDLRGDVLFAKGEQEAARDAYKKAADAIALQGGQQSAGFRSAVQTKLEALGGA